MANRLLLFALGTSLGTSLLAASAFAADDVSDLPLVEVPAPDASSDADSTLVIMLTGDGEWAAIDKEIAAAFGREGAAVVGLKMRSYLTSATRTPDGTARDVARIAEHYLPLWRRRRLLLVGYSRGADAMPFVVTRLPAELRARVPLVAMLGLASAANFRFRWADVVTTRKYPDDLPVAPELAKLRGTRLLCVYGDDEKDSGCRDADPTLMTRVGRPGGHHFDDDYPALAALIWKEAQSAERKAQRG